MLDACCVLRVDRNLKLIEDPVFKRGSWLLAAYFQFHLPVFHLMRFSNTFFPSEVIR